MIIANFIFNLYVRFLIFLGIILGLLEWDRSPNPQKLKARTKYLWEAACKRGIYLAVLKTPKGYSNICLAKRGKKNILFETLPSHHIYRINPEKIDNKSFFKKKMSQFKLPVPVGQKFLTFLNARKYARKISYPLVVKPVSRSISQGVTLNIQNETDLRKAICEAKKFQSTFMVEKFVSGKSFRILVVGQKIFACLRQPATVRGDGQSTICQLIKKRNEHNLRGPIKIDGWTLRQTDLIEAKNFLARIGLGLNDQPKKNEIIKLTDKINLGAGVDIIEYTGKIHPKNYKKFLKIAQWLQTPIIGLDVIMDDISLPWEKQNFYLIEANTIPSIDMHHQPFRGRPQDAAGAIWDLLLEKKIL